MPPRVTIAMPAYNEERYIEACIASVQHQDYPKDLIEILIADGRSTDRTLEILAQLAERDPRIKIVDNPDRLQAAGLVRLVKQAHGDIIVRMDVHCEYAADYVRKCVETIERTGADNVGGAQRAKAKTFFQRALCAALASPLGVGGAKYRSADADGFVDTVFLGAFRRRVFETVGMWDPRAITNEDAELNQRILESGGQIYLSRDIVVHYFPRDSYATLAKQYFKYGRGRARTLDQARPIPHAAPRPAVPARCRRGHDRADAAALAGRSARIRRLRPRDRRRGRPSRRRPRPPIDRGRVGHVPGPPHLARHRLRSRPLAIPPPPRLAQRPGAPAQSRPTRRVMVTLSLLSTCRSARVSQHPVII